MTPTLQSLGIDHLPAEDRLALAQAIWDSVEREIENQPLSEEQKSELDRRLAAHAANPGAAIPWERVEAEALARVRK